MDADKSERILPHLETAEDKSLLEYFILKVIEHEGMHILNNHLGRLLLYLTDEVNKDYLKNTKPLNIFFNASSDDGVDFNLDIAVDILLKTGADKIISHMDK
jgi:hypothetical protein